MASLDAFLARLGVGRDFTANGDLVVRSPIDGAIAARLQITAPADVDTSVAAADAAFRQWRVVPAPRRGELVRLFADVLRLHTEDLAALVTYESGKIREEARGEIQEMIDVCDFAVGLSRQLYGLTIASERPGHRLMETWHPLGAIGVITAFNFPVAVWAWNFAIALVCGDPVVWKPSELTPLSALACRSLFGEACRRFGADAPLGLLQIIVGGPDAAHRLATDRRLPLVSATGSCRMGRALAPLIAERFGRALLELGGNNASIVTPSADLELAARAIVFAAVGTAGQRCTTLRRLFVHQSIIDDLLARIERAYRRLVIGDPREPETHIGPLIGFEAGVRMQAAQDLAVSDGGRVFGGERVLEDRYPHAWYTRPAIARMPRQTGIVREETFAPILYVMAYTDLEDAVAQQNDVAQGLASSIFTNDVREAEFFLSALGSDCGIANVNVGPSGAEIGGAFGGEKDTGGGREAGSDAWRAYMRRATNTINFSPSLSLAQGIAFGVDADA